MDLKTELFLVLTTIVLQRVHGNTAIAKRGGLSVSPVSWKCDVDDLAGYVVEFCEGWDERDDIYVTQDGYCTVSTTHPETHATFTKTMSCQYGHWTDADNALGIPHARKKRLTALLLYGIGCWAKWWCKDPETKVVHKKPPTFPSPCRPKDLMVEYIAERSRTSVKVPWTDPKASDSDGSIKSQQQVHGIKNGKEFDGSPAGKEHTIIYSAIDNDGLSASCYFSFTVKVKTCEPLSWPLNGNIHCPQGTIFGAECEYKCNEGYVLAGSPKVSCENDGWTSTPSCEKIKCGSQPKLSDGILRCTDESNYGSVCIPSCREGYKLNGLFYKCMATKLWSGSAECVDNTPPTLHCESIQIFYADRGSSSTAVNWAMPTATDNSKQEPVVRQTGGPANGSRLEEGDGHMVTYTAKDQQGNTSPQCTITLQVKVISCGHPLDTFADPNLRFNCSMKTYTYGDTCTLFCDDNLPLNGTKFITCERQETADGLPEGVWDWTDGSKPYCREIACPDLDPPTNGALVYDTIASRPSATQLCHKDFDIPDLGKRFSGLFLCQDSGIWAPDLKKAPDCIVPFKSRGFRLPSEVYYYSGSCSDTDNIKQQFGKIVARMNKDFPHLCPADVSCSVVNPKVSCGPVEPKRKRRDTSSELGQTDLHYLQRRNVQDVVLILSFDIQVDFSSENMTLDEIYQKADSIQLELLKPVVQKMVDDGSLNMPSWEIKEDSFRTAEFGDVYCDPGTTFSKPNSCNPCPLGQFEIKGVCEVCPKGEFANSSGSSECFKCPTGFSTRHTASESKDNCTELCRPGHYSPDTFVPCAQCRLGFYQTAPGQTNCTACPVGTTTARTSSTAQTDCHEYDVLFKEIGTPTAIANASQMMDMTVSFWMKTVSPEPPNATIYIGDIAYLAITKNWTLVTEKWEETVGGWSHWAWVHVALSWNSTDSHLSAYSRGKLVLRRWVERSEDSPSYIVGNLSITNGNGSGLLVSGFRVQDTVLSQSLVDQVSSQCLTDVEGDVVTMDVFKNLSVVGITLQTPSICDAVDDCVNTPCGIHDCWDERDGFACSCLDGWTGTTCDIPPDFCPANECTNGATCVSGASNYTCTCMPGYRGIFCQVAPVDGAWSDWSAWSECSATCGGGNQSRSRVCDSPAPDMHGKDCTGDVTQTQACNNKTCPECPTISRGFGTLLKCNTDPDTKTETCQVLCKPGFNLPAGTISDRLQCGLNTSYKWQPFDRVPDCVKPNRTKRFAVESRVAYKEAVPPAAAPLVEKALYDNTADTDCRKTASCKLSIRINTEVSGRGKRSTGSTVVVSFSVDIEGTSDLELEKFATNGTVSEGLQELIDAVETLQATAKAINESASSIFDVEVDGTSYNVDPDTLTFDGEATCGEGQVVANGLCEECPTGTFKDDDICSYCEKGMYQDQTGQSACRPCPTGFTTATVGTKALSDCYELCRAGSYQAVDGCEHCEIGTYQPMKGQYSCIPCLDGYTTRSTGSVSRSQCIDLTDPTKPLPTPPTTLSTSTASTTQSTKPSTTVKVKPSTTATIGTSKTTPTTQKTTSSTPTSTASHTMDIVPLSTKLSEISTTVTRTQPEYTKDLNDLTKPLPTTSTTLTISTASTTPSTIPSTPGTVMPLTTTTIGTSKTTPKTLKTTSSTPTSTASPTMDIVTSSTILSETSTTVTRTQPEYTKDPDLSTVQPTTTSSTVSTTTAATPTIKPSSSTTTAAPRATDKATTKPSSAIVHLSGYLVLALALVLHLFVT